MSKKDFICFLKSTFGYSNAAVYKIINNQRALSFKKAVKIVEETTLTYEDLQDLTSYFNKQKEEEIKKKQEKRMKNAKRQRANINAARQATANA